MEVAPLSKQRLNTGDCAQENVIAVFKEIRMVAVRIGAVVERQQQIAPRISLR